MVMWLMSAKRGKQRDCNDNQRVIRGTCLNCAYGQMFDEKCGTKFMLVND